MAKGDIRQGSTPIRKVFEMMIEEMGLGEKLTEARMLEALPELFGDPIMNKVDRFYIHERKLFLHIRSAPMKHELTLMKDVILEKMNRLAGKEVVVDIVFR